MGIRLHSFRHLIGARTTPLASAYQRHPPKRNADNTTGSGRPNSKAISPHRAFATPHDCVPEHHPFPPRLKAEAHPGSTGGATESSHERHPASDQHLVGGPIKRQGLGAVAAAARLPSRPSQTPRPFLMEKLETSHRFTKPGTSIPRSSLTIP
jgi:hypothetical protein